MKKLLILLSCALIIGTAQLNAMKRDNNNIITAPEPVQAPWLPSELIPKIAASCDPETRANLSSISKWCNACASIKNNPTIIDQPEFEIEKDHRFYYLIYGCIYNLKNLVIKALQKFNPDIRGDKEACYFIKQLAHNEATELLSKYDYSYSYILDEDYSVVDWAFDRTDSYNITQALRKLILKSSLINFEQIKYTLENLVENIDEPNSFLKERQYFIKLLLDDPRTNIKELEMSDMYVSSLVKTLLTYPDYDVNQRDSIGNTPLHHAVQNCKLKTVKLLLAHPDTDITLQNNKKETPLILALKTKTKIYEDAEDWHYDKIHAIIAQLLLDEGMINHTQHYTGK